MRYDRRKKLTILILLLVGVFAISIGFSAYSSTLKIESGLAVTPDSTNFSVKFSSSATALATDPVAPSSKSEGLETVDATITNSATPTIGGYSATFTKDGQYVTYSFYVRNTGDYTAYLNSIRFGTDKSCSAKKGTDETSVNDNCGNINTKTTVKVGNITTTATKLDITDETLEPNESKLVEVTFEYIDGGSVIDGDFSISFPAITLYYASTNGLNSPQDDESRYENSTSTTDSIILSNITSTTLRNYRIYGSSSGVGDSNGSEYVIPVTVRGKNKVKFDANYDYIANGTIVEILDSGAVVQGGGTGGNNQWAAGWYYVAYQNYGTNGIYLEAGEKVTISADYTWLDITNLTSNTRGIYLYGTENFTNYITSKIETNVLKRETATYTVNTSGYYYLLFTLNSSKVKIENIQVSTLDDITYEPYVEPTTFNITLTSPLMEGDYIDFESQKVVRSNGTTESISIPQITTFSVPTTIIEVGTANTPSKIEVTYFE